MQLLNYFNNWENFVVRLKYIVLCIVISLKNQSLYRGPKDVRSAIKEEKDEQLSNI